MTDAPLTILAMYPTEFEANLAVEKLAEHGIRAMAVGGFTAGFLAEVPGQVQVLVAPADVDEARRHLGDA